MPTELTLAEFAERIAPRDYRAWRAMRTIHIGEARVSASRVRRIDRAADQLVGKHRQERMTRYKIDPETFLSAERPSHGSIGAVLGTYPTARLRESFIADLALSEARQEAARPLMARYQRRCGQLALRIGEKLLAEMKDARVDVTATIDGVTRRALTRVELVHARIDLVREALTIGQHTWGLVQIELPATSTAPAALLTSADGDAARENLQGQFDAELRRRIQARKRSQAGNRDGMLQWARSRLEVSPDDAHALWENRSPEFSRRAGRHPRSQAA